MFFIRRLTATMGTTICPRETLSLPAPAVVSGAVATELAARIDEPELLDQFRRFKDVRFLDTDDMARAVAFMIEQPDYVSINQMQIRPTNQEF